GGAEALHRCRDRAAAGGRGVRVAARGAAVDESGGLRASGRHRHPGRIPAGVRPSTETGHRRGRGRVHPPHDACGVAGTGCGVRAARPAAASVRMVQIPASRARPGGGGRLFARHRERDQRQDAHLPQPRGTACLGRRSATPNRGRLYTGRDGADPPRIRSPRWERHHPGMLDTRRQCLRHRLPKRV
ncbi:MAG: hypothetical protein AVDCRST_MAG59-4807, partial [uncultured Thermomicrobiales bacterium]